MRMIYLSDGIFLHFLFQSDSVIILVMARTQPNQVVFVPKPVMLCIYYCNYDNKGPVHENSVGSIFTFTLEQRF